MTTVVVTVAVVCLVAGGILQTYFTVGAGRRVTIGNPDHWWNRRVTGHGRRLIGVIIAVTGGWLLFSDLQSRHHTFGGWPFDAVLVVVGLLTAAGILPRRRSGHDYRDDPGSETTNPRPADSPASPDGR